METLKKTLAALPHRPGVYRYLDREGKVMYIGKAKDLYKRVHQYFDTGPHDQKTINLVSHIHAIETTVVPSEFEALLLEARLIRQHQPKYNAIAKDDKSPIYLVITMSERLPRLYITRKRTIDASSDVHPKDAVFGPFSSSAILRSILRRIRYSIPYCSAKIRSGAPCFYTHISLCNPCPSVLCKLPSSKKTNEQIRMYRKNLRNIAAVFSGKSRTVLQLLEREMHDYANMHHFEDAAVVKQHIDNLHGLFERRLDPMTYTDAKITESEQKNDLAMLQSALVAYFPEIGVPQRIECIDISNISGRLAVGSLVVSVNGLPDTNEYRRFRIRRGNTPNDMAMIKEVLARRLAHTEWPYPDLLVIDGGKPQLSGAREALHQAGVTIPIIGLAKRREILVVPLVHGWTQITLPLTSPALHVLERLRDEAHRFAITYHRLLRKKKLKQDFSALQG